MNIHCSEIYSDVKATSYQNITYQHSKQHEQKTHLTLSEKVRVNFVVVIVTAEYKQ